MTDDALISRVAEAREWVARGKRVFRPDIVSALCDEIDRLRATVPATTTELECPACGAHVVVGGDKMECAARCGWWGERAIEPATTTSARAAAEEIVHELDHYWFGSVNAERKNVIAAIILRHGGAVAATDRAGDRATLHCEFCGVGHVCERVGVGEVVQVNNKG